MAIYKWLAVNWMIYQYLSNADHFLGPGAVRRMASAQRFGMSCFGGRGRFFDATAEALRRRRVCRGGI